MANANNNDIHIFKLGISFKNIAVNTPNTIVAIPNPNGLTAQYCPKYSYDHLVE